MRQKSPHQAIKSPISDQKPQHSSEKNPPENTRAKKSRRRKTDSSLSFSYEELMAEYTRTYFFLQEAFKKINEQLPEQKGESPVNHSQPELIPTIPVIRL